MLIESFSLHVVDSSGVPGENAIHAFSLGVILAVDNRGRTGSPGLSTVLSSLESSWEVSMSAVPFTAETLMAGLEERESSSVSVVKFGLESMTEDMIGREVEEEWDCSETVIGMSGLEQREDGSVSMVSGMQGRGVGDKKVSDEGWQRDGSNDVG